MPTNQKTEVPHAANQQEWTVKKEDIPGVGCFVYLMHGNGVIVSQLNGEDGFGFDQYTAIADAHDAALAAANKDKERWRLACNNKSSHDRILELEQQLAAERKKRDKLTDFCIGLSLRSPDDIKRAFSERDELRQQLLQALAAIEEHNKGLLYANKKAYGIKIDLSALDKFKKDTERMDWLDKCTNKPDGFWTEFNSCRDIRELIDTTIELMKNGACES